MASFLHWGTEPGDMVAVGSVTVETNAARLDPLVDCGFLVATQTQNDAAIANFARTVGQFNSSFLCVSATMWTNTAGGTSTFITSSGSFLIRLLDTNGVPRLALTWASGNGGPTGPFRVVKLDAAGHATQLGATFSGIQANVKQRITMIADYTGTIAIRVGLVNKPSALLYSFSGAFSTDGVTTFGGYDFGPGVTPSTGSSGDTVWSAVVSADFDCGSISLKKLALTGAGAVSDWSGASDGSTVSELDINITDGIDTPSPGKVELFTAPGTLPAGSWSIVGVGIAAYASASPFEISPGVFAPQHMQEAVGIGGTAYFSPTSAAIAASLDRVAYCFLASPATSNPFTSSEIASLQVGLKSIA